MDKKILFKWNFIFFQWVLMINKKQNGVFNASYFLLPKFISGWLPAFLVEK
jgi:hypothetical protein